MPSDSDELLRKIGAWLFILGPIQFVVAMGVEQALRPGYSDVTNAISDLGVNGSYFNPPNSWGYAWIFNTSIVILAVCVFLGIAMVWRSFPHGKWFNVGIVSLFFAGLGSMIVGFFPENHPLPHSVGAFLAFFFAGLGMVIFSMSFEIDPHWKPLATATLLAGIVDLGALVAFLAASDLGARWVLERLIVAPVLIWAPVVGIRALQQRAEDLKRVAAPSSPQLGAS